MDTTGSYGTGKIRRLERRLSYISAKLVSPDVEMSEGVRNHMIDEKEALEWALPILRRSVCYEVDGHLVGGTRDRENKNVADRVSILEDKANRLIATGRNILARMYNILYSEDDEVQSRVSKITECDPKND